MIIGMVMYQLPRANLRVLVLGSVSSTRGKAATRVTLTGV